MTNYKIPAEAVSQIGNIKFVELEDGIFVELDNGYVFDSEPTEEMVEDAKRNDMYALADVEKTDTGYDITINEVE